MWLVGCRSVKSYFTYGVFCAMSRWLQLGLQCPMQPGSNTQLFACWYVREEAKNPCCMNEDS